MQNANTLFNSHKKATMVTKVIENCLLIYKKKEKKKKRATFEMLLFNEGSLPT